MQEPRAYVLRKLIPLFGMRVEFTASWCHAKTLTHEQAAQIWEIDPVDAAVEDAHEREVTGWLDAEFRGYMRADVHKASDPALLSRPGLIRLLSLLTFLSKHAYSTAMPVGSRGYNAYPGIALPDKPPVVERTCLIVGDVDQSDQLEKILAATSENNTKSLLIFSMLDRWRKGLYLSQELDDNAAEESALCFFHVLEIAAGHFANAACNRIRVVTAEFIDQVVSEVFLLDEGTSAEICQRLTSDFAETLCSLDYLNARTQLAFALNELALLDDKTKAVVGRIVKLRNEIAHGRLSAARPHLTWPVRPFFLQSDPHDEDLWGVLPVLSARIIAVICGADSWAEEWAATKYELHPSDTTIEAFVKAGSNPPPIAFEQGEVRPSSIVWYWLRKRTKMGLRFLEPLLAPYLLAVEVTDENQHEVLLPALLLADSQDAEIAATSKRLTEKVFAIEGGHWDASDLWKYFAQFGVEPQWLTSWARHQSPPPSDAIDITK